MMCLLCNMVRRLRSFIGRRRRWIATGLVLAVVAVNALAFMHARAMTHFVMEHDGDGTRVHAQQVAAMPWWRKARMALTGFEIPRPVNRLTPAAAALPFTTHHFRTADGVELDAWQIPH